MLTELPAIENIAPPVVLKEQPLRDVLRRYSLDDDGALTPRVHRLLHSLIVSLHLMPNQALPENEIAAVLGVSKTPIREAFIRLAEERLILFRPQRTPLVSPIDIRRVFEGYFIRISLESACAEQLARNGEPWAFEALENIILQMKRNLDAGELNRLHRLDDVFHSATFDLAGLPHTRRQVEIAKAEIDRVKHLRSVYRFCRSDELLYEEHKAIYQAIADRDPDRARREIDLHLTGMSRAIQDIAKDERLWRFVSQVNQVSINTKLAGREAERGDSPGLSLPNHQMEPLQV